jgi:SPP1 family predicted phage head-tail adaptor
MGTIGSKRTRIQIERAVLTTDAQGGRATTWTPRCVVWAHERPLTGREALQAGQVTAVVSSVWEIWYRTDVSVKDRITVGTRTMAIAAVIDPTDTRKELHLAVSEVQA